MRGSRRALQVLGEGETRHRMTRRWVLEIGSWALLVGLPHLNIFSSPIQTGKPSSNIGRSFHNTVWALLANLYIIRVYLYGTCKEGLDNTSAHLSNGGRETGLHITNFVKSKLIRHGPGLFLWSG